MTPAAVAILARIERDLARLRVELRGDDTTVAPAEAEALADKLAELQAACADRGVRISGDGYVREADAAALLNRSPRTLGNWRTEGRPGWRRRHGRVEWHLEAVAGLLSAPIDEF